MDRIAVIDAEAARFAQVLSAADPTAPVPTCPEWNAADLAWHLTEVHLFWAGILARAARTEEQVAEVDAGKPDRPADVAGILAVRAQATADLLDQLRRLDDSEARWSWWPPDQTVGFTRRMQTYEATMHRIDAELAAGLAVSPIAADVAAGAVEHCIDVMWGWLPDGATYAPLARLELVATDTDQRWDVEVGHWTKIGEESGKHYDEPRAVRGPGPSDTPVATVRAPAQELARWAWSRRGTVERSGDPVAVAAVDALIAAGIP
jgi:uncharacterized protein (TIGR03083 family)